MFEFITPEEAGVSSKQVAEYISYLNRRGAVMHSVLMMRHGKIFAEYDAVMLPACSAMTYTAEEVKAAPFKAFEENIFTAPASISGLPAVVCGGVQLIGKAFSDQALIGAAKLLEKEGK